MKHKKHWLISLALALLFAISALLACLPAAHADEWGVDDAKPVSAQWQQLNLKSYQWYWFDYAGDGSPIEVRLEAVPEGSATFAVWTPGLIEKWGLGFAVEPIGRAASDSNAAGQLTWTGSFPESGRYYVAVEHTGSTAGKANYLLTVSGSGVSLVKPVATPTPVATKVAVKTKPATEPTGKLVFQTTFGGDFYTLNVDGTGLKRITNGIDPVWSPSGQQIAFVRWTDERGIWVVNADGSGLRRVFDWQEARYPSWSADGREIVFSRQYRGRLEDVEKCVVMDGHFFCFVRPANPHYNLAVVRAGDGSLWEPLASTSERSLTPDWSPDGKQMVYDDVYGLFVQSADGRTRYQITDRNLDTSPDWSPDGKQVAFIRQQHDHWEIYTVDADGRNLKRLTNTPERTDGTVGSSVSPAWSPDGNHIAFLTDRTGEWEIWVMEADGSNQRSLFDTELNKLTLDYTFNGERAISWAQ